MIDAVLSINDDYGVYDFTLNENGDIATEESFDTAILYSLFGERRASPDEIVEPSFRRGWIGNDEDFENGSKIWLLEQSRSNRETLNSLEDFAKISLAWFVDDGLAVRIDDVEATITSLGVEITISIRRSLDDVDRKNFLIWENTGAS